MRGARRGGVLGEDPMLKTLVFLEADRRTGERSQRPAAGVHYLVSLFTAFPLHQIPLTTAGRAHVKYQAVIATKLTSVIYRFLTPPGYGKNPHLRVGIFRMRVFGGE